VNEDKNGTMDAPHILTREEAIAEPCATCGAAAGVQCNADCVWVVVGFGPLA